MSHDISTNRLLLISCIGTSGSIGVGHDLIGDDNRNAELRIRVPSALDQARGGTVSYLICQPLQRAQELA